MADSDELVLVERVILRIGMAESDEQLEVALSKFLAPVLLKLNSQTDGVRKKVMELLVHVNKRLKSRPKVQLPVKDLMEQYTNKEIQSFVTNFTSLYIKLGYPRQEPAFQSEYMSLLLTCMEGKPAAQQEIFIQLFIRALYHLKLPDDDDKKKEVFKFSEKPEVLALLLEGMMDFLFLLYGPGGRRGEEELPSETEEESGESTPLGPDVVDAASLIPPNNIAPGGIPAGLSETACKRVTLDPPPTTEELEKIKVGILKFLGQGMLENKDILCHLVVALGDGRHSVVTLAEKELKRLAGAEDWNEPGVVQRLYSVFQGTVVLKGQPQVKPENKRSPASLQLRMKLLPYLLKSRQAASQFPSCIQVVFDCLYGTNTNMKLKTLAVQFVHHLCLFCPDAKFTPIGSVLLSGMVRLLGEVRDNPRLRNLAYVAVGKIAIRVPEVVTKDIALLQTFFEAMTKEDADNKLAVQEALSMMARAFKTIDPANRKLLEALIMQNVESPDPQARLVAVQYANTVFPQDHIPSRFVLLLACGDMKENVYIEATKALRTLKKLDDPFAPKQSSEDKLLPSFVDMVNYISEQSTARMKTQNKFMVGNHALPFNPAAYGEMLMYLRMCLAYESGVEPMLESTTAMQEQAPVISKCVRRLLQQTPGDKGPISTYLRIIQQLLYAIGGAPAMYCLVEVVAVAKDRLAPQFIKQLDWLKTFMHNSREDMREFAAQLYAIVVANACSPKNQRDIINSLINNVSNQALEGQHGAMLAIAYIIGEIFRNQKIGQKEGESSVLQKLDKPLHDSIVKAVVKIVGMLDNSQSVLSGGACVALGEIGRSGPIPLPDETSDKKPSKLSVVENLIKKVQSTKENQKVREKAAAALGFLCVGHVNFPHHHKVIEGILESVQPKQIELQFTLGDSLACAALGPASPDARDVWTCTAEDFKPPPGVADKSEVAHVIKLLLTKYTVSPNPHVRQASCIWLLSVAKSCGHHPVTQAKLMNIQGAFMRLLADSDEITQDIASKGLGVVYDNCSEEERKGLVSSLVDTLTGNQRKTQQVTSDTQLFEDGSIGKAPDGSNLSTYKELCSIASDLNQPDLVYKFMHLANHNALWNSKKGAAFGFTTIAAQAGEQLAPYLHKIVPKLYRYQFDPNPKINQAMTSIWSAVVPETQKTVDKYLKEILRDLLMNLTANQWRVRESSCLALNDAVRGRQLDDVIDLMPEIWETLLRVMDDIKESVRKAAETAGKTLSRVSIKICDPSYGQVGSQATSLVLPCLLKNGLNSPVNEIRNLCLNTILKISKNAGVLLKPHIPVLVAALLEALSGLEPQQLNYISLHMGSEVSQEKLDMLRIAAIKTSPMMETINLTIQYVDESVIPELLPRVLDIMKSGIGLGTKAGCSHFIIQLVGHCPRDIAPYAGKLLAALLSGLHDRNLTVKKNYALAIGYVVKVAKDSSVEKLLKRLLDWYMEKDDSSTKMTCAATVHAICMQSPDVFERHVAIALPLAFLGMNEKQEIDDSKAETNSKTLWEEVWNDGTPGIESGLKLYMTEIVTLSKQALVSQAWDTKAQGAATINLVAQKLGAGLGPPHLGLLLDALLTGLQGRTWTGKEALLKALKSVCTSSKEAVAAPTDETQPTLEKIIESLLKECGKEKLHYKQEALQSLCIILETHELDHYSEVKQILLPMVKQVEDDVVEETPQAPEESTEGDAVESMDTSDAPSVEENAKKLKEVKVSEEKRETKKRRRRQEKREEYDATHDQWLQFEQVVFECFGQAWPNVGSTQVNHQEELCQLLTGTLNTNVWKVDLTVLKTFQKYLKRLLIFKSKENFEKSQDVVSRMLQYSLQPLCQSIGNMKYSAIRTEATVVLEILVNYLEGFQGFELISPEELIATRRALQSLTRDSQPTLCDKAIRLLKILPLPPPPPPEEKEEVEEVEEQTDDNEQETVMH